jgi:hypothetical protein
MKFPVLVLPNFILKNSFIFKGLKLQRAEYCGMEQATRAHQEKRAQSQFGSLRTGPVPTTKEKCAYQDALSSSLQCSSRWRLLASCWFPVAAWCLVLARSIRALA